MTHNEKRTVWWKEGMFGLGTGVLYGLTSVAIGHPFDTVKTKMQAQVAYQSSGMFNAFSTVLRTQGVKGLYAGCVAPMWGSGLYRSIQFAVYEALYTKWSHTPHTHIPHTRRHRRKNRRRRKRVVWGGRKKRKKRKRNRKRKHTHHKFHPRLFLWIKKQTKNHTHTHTQRHGHTHMYMHMNVHTKNHVCVCVCMQVCAMRIYFCHLQVSCRTCTHNTHKCTQMFRF
eukprot:GDKI01033494.1.p1 GENE.GDKI01033494.1~~GDKI01033494.1.p1  ORF type:complete len:226 (-),score=64.66 GDKI01033494.1:57-734(-)